MTIEELHNLITEKLDLQGMSRDTKNGIIEQFTQNVLARTATALFERLPESAQAEFKRLAEEENSEALIKLLQSHIPDMNDFIRAEVDDELAISREL